MDPPYTVHQPLVKYPLAMLLFLERPAVLTLAATMASFVCFIAGTRELRRTAGSRTSIWWLFSVVLLGIAMAHAWNLGGAAAESGRDAFRFEGLYGIRRPIQAAVIFVLSAGTLAALASVAPFVRTRFGPEMVTPTLVLAGLMGYLLIRTISLHQVDALLYNNHVLAAHPGTLIELGGLLLFVYTALRAADHEARPTKRPPAQPGVQTGRMRPQRSAHEGD